MKRSCYSTRLSNDFLHGNAYHDWRIWKLNASVNDWSSRYILPRLNNIGFWLLPPALVLLLLSSCVELGRNGMNCVSAISWNSIPLRGAADCAIFALHVAGASSILGAVNFITTVMNMRAPGISLHRMPLFVWRYFSCSGSSVISCTCFSRSDYDAINGSKL